jgi:hypothetical protein
VTTTDPAARTDARAQITSGLRALADYLDAHPDVPVNEYGWTLNDFPPRDDDAAGRAAVTRVAASLGVTPDDDTARSGHYIAARTFGRITYQYIHISARRRAIHDAWSSYSSSVTPADDTPEAA